MQECPGTYQHVEARESLVDRNGNHCQVFNLNRRRGSREPRGSKSFCVGSPNFANRSRLARASWIEICRYARSFVAFRCRGSREPRGSKLLFVAAPYSSHTSRLARASWIEIGRFARTIAAGIGRGSREPRGSKFPAIEYRYTQTRRGSREPRGSKSQIGHGLSVGLLSRLARASWIEIYSLPSSYWKGVVEARESLVDRNLKNGYKNNSQRSRGSREPRGSKL